MTESRQPGIPPGEEEKVARSVVQSWVADSGMSLKQQTVVLCALRGCDGLTKEDPSKALVRWYRSVVLVSAHPGGGVNTFMRDAHDFIEAASRFMNNGLDHYPMHWLMHFAHGVEIVGFYHPDRSVRDRASKLYNAIVVDGLHLREEQRHDCNMRLRDGHD